MYIYTHCTSVPVNLHLQQATLILAFQPQTMSLVTLAHIAHCTLHTLHIAQEHIAHCTLHKNILHKNIFMLWQQPPLFILWKWKWYCCYVFAKKCCWASLVLCDGESSELTVKVLWGVMKVLWSVALMIGTSIQRCMSVALMRCMSVVLMRCMSVLMHSRKLKRGKYRCLHLSCR